MYRMVRLPVLHEHLLCCRVPISCAQRVAHESLVFRSMALARYRQTMILRIYDGLMQRNSPIKMERRIAARARIDHTFSQSRSAQCVPLSVHCSNLQPHVPLYGYELLE